jgi:ABC-type bacteriocin/lantibiotic exporter with double-glycine peptidase domain
VQDLSFGFPENPDVLKNISLHIPSGDKVCVIGNEGAGKSLLLRMFIGAYNDYKGSVLLNGIPVNNYDLRTLHQRVGIILNHQDIFYGTVLNNITLGNPDIPLSDVTRLAAITQFDQYIPKLQDGFNTFLNVGGERLSKAAVQKILIMRALIHKPNLLLLDDPWNALNRDSRERIEHHILNELPNTTTIVAANDQALAQKCDSVIVMHHGTIQATGKADDVFHYLN